MPRSDNEAKADFMARHGLVAAMWSEDGDLISATRSTTAPARPAQPAAPAGPAAKLASSFAERMKRDHDVRFAATHFRPRIDAAPVAEDPVPRAVRAKQQASSGRPSSRKSNR